MLAVLEAAVGRSGIGDRVEILATTCRDRCDYGPSMNVYPGPVFYNLLDEGALEEIVSRHLASGAVAGEWLFRPKPARSAKGTFR